MTLGTTKVPQNLDFCGGELKNFKLQNLTAAPENFVESMPYYDTVNHVPKYHNGTSLVEFGRIYSPGTGINISAGNEISVNLSETNIPNLASSKITAMTGYSIASAIAAISTSDSLNTAVGKLEYHLNNLGTSDIPDLSGTYIATSQKGANNGVASLGSDGKVPSSQLPAFVDDVIDLLTVASSAPATCATGDKYYNSTSSKIFTATGTNTWGTTGATPVSDAIYVATDTNATYRWSGSSMINIANPIGQATESTAGIAEIATNTEVTTGTDDTRIVTPLKAATYYQKKLTADSQYGIIIDENNNIKVKDYYTFLKNKATTLLGDPSGNSLTILGTPTHGDMIVNIGFTSQVDGHSPYSVALGYGAKIMGMTASGGCNVAIGGYAQITDSAHHSIQLGAGTNNTSYTFYVGTGRESVNENKNWYLLDLSTGLIPDARISSTAKKLKYAADNPALTASGGVATWEITHGLGTDDVHLVVKEISTGEIIFPAWKISSGKVTITFLASANISAGTYRAIIMG